ncbi:hypothetical protein ACRAWD_07695 [Caulobacter segnis]
MRGVGEMRVKESDRIALTAAGLEACGVDVEEEPEGLHRPRDRSARRAARATVETHGDHRIAMSHLILGLAAQACGRGRARHDRHQLPRLRRH